MPRAKGWSGLEAKHLLQSSKPLLSVHPGKSGSSGAIATIYSIVHAGRHDDQKFKLQSCANRLFRKSFRGTIFVTL